MDWQRWVDEGIIAPDHALRTGATQTVAASWNYALDARRAYQSGELSRADAHLREAFLKATHALLEAEGYAPCTDYTCDFARAVSEAYFGPTIAGDLYGTLDEIDATACEDDHAVKRGVTAAATYAAVVGSRIDF